MTECTRCGSHVPAETTFFAASGEICAACHAREEASDSAALAAASEPERHRYGPYGAGGIALDLGGMTVHVGGTGFGLLAALLALLFGRR